MTTNFEALPSLQDHRLAQSGESVQVDAAGPKILILDDDTHFRELVGSILHSQGYGVVEARSAPEASECVAAQHPAMAVVDFRLPGMDGMTWIKKLREDGNNMPIIFVSGSWCDAKTFNILRNLLKVSLVIQKPIVPETFMHTVEMLMPVQAAKASETHSLNTESLEEKLLERATDESIKQLDDLLASPTLDPRAINELTLLRKKIRTRQVIGEARAKFLDILPELWKEFVTNVQNARVAHNDFSLIAAAREQAHKLKGSTGSYGFTALAGVIAQIEQLLVSLDPAHMTEQEVIWSEIVRNVAEGTQIICQLGTGKATMPVLSKGAPLSLLIATPGTERELVFETASELGFLPEFAHSGGEILVHVNKRPVDAMIIDMHLGPANRIWNLIGTIRSMPRMARVPFALIAPSEEELTLAHLVYLGCSAISERLDDKPALTEALKYLQADCAVNKPRILCVDDDPLLTGFMETILKDQGFVVKSTNEPIGILEALDEFAPDLIVLDVIMPGLTGYEVCRMLRAHELWHDVPIIFLTAKSDAAGKAAAYAAGGNDFLSKPVLPDELFARVKAQLALSPRHDRSREEQAGLYQFDQFCRFVKISADCSRKNGFPSTLALIRMNDYETIALQSSFSKGNPSSILANLIAARFRVSDMRCAITDNLYAIYLPGEDSKQAKEALQLLQEEWSQLWQEMPVANNASPKISIVVAEMGVDGSSAEELLTVARSRLPESPVFALTVRNPEWMP